MDNRGDGLHPEFDKRGESLHTELDDELLLELSDSGERGDIICDGEVEEEEGDVDSPNVFMGMDQCELGSFSCDRLSWSACMMDCFVVMRL